jgi:hypothetical protein
VACGLFLRAPILALLLASACTQPPDPPIVHEAVAARRGDLAGLERVGGYPVVVAKLLVWWAGLSERLPVEHGVTLYRVSYWTLGERGGVTRASGLLALPHARSLRGVVSWQHGTIVERSGAPSAPSPDEGVVASLAFGGHGYLLVAPDYAGLGQSLERHPYYVAEVAAANVVDLLRAARTVLASRGLDWPQPLLLSGFSQGGHATLAALRALEEAPEPGLQAAGAAPIAGPYDLSGLSFPRALEGEAPSSSLYLAYLTDAYARAYGEPLGSVLRSPWVERVPSLFDGSHDGSEVAASLPRDPRELFQPEFLDAIGGGRPSWLTRRLRENDLTEFVPRAPVRLYYGSLDVDVSPEESRRHARRLGERGADARAVDVGALDHDASVLEAAPRVREWFDELAAAHAAEGARTASPAR